MARESFVDLKNFFWLWFSLLLVVASGIAYCFDDSIGGRNGGTTLGYTLGAISTIGILYLMWYGIRKRSYHAKHTTLKAVLSSHIWIGVALVFIVAFHSGFSYGWNVHTLTYGLMLVTVVSGIWGALLFRSLPLELRSQRGGATIAQLAATLHALSVNINELISSDKTPRSDAFLKMAGELNRQYNLTLIRCLFCSLARPLNSLEVAKKIEALPEDEQEDGVALVALLSKKQDTVKKIQRETRAQTLIRGWLFFHLPVSIALCVALAIHIFSVFYFR